VVKLPKTSDCKKSFFNYLYELCVWGDVLVFSGFVFKWKNIIKLWTKWMIKSRGCFRVKPLRVAVLLFQRSRAALEIQQTSFAGPICRRACNLQVETPLAYLHAGPAAGIPLCLAISTPRCWVFGTVQKQRLVVFFYQLGHFLHPRCLILSHALLPTHQPITCLFTFDSQPSEWESEQKTSRRLN
jgi:hypothetical protein